jgi:hypothetical protein
MPPLKIIQCDNIFGPLVMCFHLAKNILPTPRAQTNKVRKVNRIPCLHPKDTWTTKTLEEIMDVVKKGHFSMKRAN